MDLLFAPIEGAAHQEFGNITVDIVWTANGRIKRLVYLPEFRWSMHLKPLVGTALCMHAHVDFLARGMCVAHTPTAAFSSSSHRKGWWWSLSTMPGSSGTRPRC